MGYHTKFEGTIQLSNKEAAERVEKLFADSLGVFAYLEDTEVDVDSQEVDVNEFTEEDASVVKACLAIALLPREEATPAPSLR